MESRVNYRALIALAAATVMAGAASAKGSPEEVEKLGKSLTCVGAEKAGTASGVPEYTGKWLGTPPGIQYTPHVGQHPWTLMPMKSHCSPSPQRTWPNTPPI